MLNSKRRIPSRRIEVDFFNVRHCGKTRTRRQLILESFDTLCRPFCQRFDAAIIQVLYKANDLMARRHPLGKETKADTLHVTTDEEPARYFVTHLILTGTNMLTRR